MYAHQLQPKASGPKPSFVEPPEILRGTPDVNDKSDMWSFGCVAYELLKGKKAFSCVEEVYNYMRSKKNPNIYFDHADRITKFYIAELLEHEPDNRPAAREPLNSKFTGERPLAKIMLE